MTTNQLQESLFYLEELQKPAIHLELLIPLTNVKWPSIVMKENERITNTRYN